MKNIFSSLSSRFLAGCSLVYASAQLLRLFLLLLVAAFLSDLRSHIKSQSSLHQDLQPDLDAPLDDPLDWIPEDLTDEEITQIWLDMLSEPDIQKSCTHHLTRCYEAESTTKPRNIA